MRSTTLLFVFVSAAFLAGCGDHQVASVKDGECKAFQRSAVEACGLTQADQDFIDDTIETGVSACKWKRPQPRTPSCADLRAEIAGLRAEVAKSRAVPQTVPPVKSVPLSPAKKRPFWRRVLGKQK